MTRHPLSKRPSRALLEWPTAALLASAALLATPALSLAQPEEIEETPSETETSGGDVTVAILSIGGESQNGLGTVWISLEDCNDNAEIMFRLDEVPSEDRKELAVYVGEDCNTAASRNDDGTECQRVTEDDIDILGPTDQRIPLKIADIMRAAFTGEDACSPKSSSPRIWFLALDVAGSAEEADDDSWGYLQLNIDTDPPKAPTNIKGGRGENEIPVSWSVGNSEVDSFEVYVDSGSGGTPIRDASTEPGNDTDGGTEPPTTGESNDMCGGGALSAGGRAEDVVSLLRKSEGSPTATSTTLSASAIEGDTAAVAVVALDEAGNRSPLSTVECVFVVPTTGFKDALGDVPQGCPCSAAGPAQLEGMLPIGLALSVLAYRRRRRS